MPKSNTFIYSSLSAYGFGLASSFSTPKSLSSLIITLIALELLVNSSGSFDGLMVYGITKVATIFSFVGSNYSYCEAIIILGVNDCKWLSSPNYFWLKTKECIMDSCCKVLDTVWLLSKLLSSLFFLCLLPLFRDFWSLSMSLLFLWTLPICFFEFSLDGMIYSPLISISVVRSFIDIFSIYVLLIVFLLLFDS